MISNKNSSGPKISFRVASKFPPANSDDLIGNPQSRISASSKLLFTIRSVNILISYPGPPGLRTNKHGFHGYSRCLVVASIYHSVSISDAASHSTRSLEIDALLLQKTRLCRSYKLFVGNVKITGKISDFDEVMTISAGDFVHNSD